MSKRYVYVEAGFTCHRSDASFDEKIDKYLRDGTLVHANSLLRKDKKTLVEKIMAHFGEFEDCTPEDVGDSCFLYGTSLKENDWHCQCNFPSHCFDLNCLEHVKSPYYESYLVGYSKDDNPLFYTYLCSGRPRFYQLIFLDKARYYFYSFGKLCYNLY